MTCSICLDKFVYPIIFNCGHTFDQQCSKELKNCPLCRENITTRILNRDLAEVLGIDCSKLDYDTDVLSLDYRLHKLFTETNINDVIKGDRLIVKILHKKVYHTRNIKITNIKLDSDNKRYCFVGDIIYNNIVYLNQNIYCDYIVKVWYDNETRLRNETSRTSCSLL